MKRRNFIAGIVAAVATPVVALPVEQPIDWSKVSMAPETFPPSKHHGARGENNSLIHVDECAYYPMDYTWEQAQNVRLIRRGDVTVFDIPLVTLS